MLGFLLPLGIMAYNSISDAADDARRSRDELERQTREQKRHNRKMEKIALMSDEERKEYLERESYVDASYVLPILKDHYSNGIRNLLYR